MAFDFKKEYKEFYHHEIYLSNPRRCEVSKVKTVVRHPIKKIIHS